MPRPILHQPTDRNHDAFGRRIRVVFFLLMALFPVAAPAAESATAPSLPVAVETEQTPQAMPGWLHALAKTATYESLASIDALVVGLWWSGDAVTGGLFAGASAATAATAYYLHEVAWNYFGSDPNAADPAVLGLWKTLTYRVVSGARVLTLTWILTGSPAVSGAYVLVNTVLDATIYYGNDLAWGWWGPPVEHLGR